MPNSHTQDTFVQVGDEFLLQYFATARIPHLVMHSRYFVIGHTIELYSKSLLSTQIPVKEYTGHDVYSYMTKADKTLALSKEEMDAGKKLYSSDTVDFDIGLSEEHREALEIYVGTHFVKDQKYYLGKDQMPIYPGTRPTVPVNNRFLDITSSLRNKIMSETTQNPDPRQIFLDDLLSRGFSEINIDEFISSKYLNKI